MTEAQRVTVADLLFVLGATELHHGDCVGADSDAHDVAEGLGLRVVVHPPADGSLRANRRGEEVRAPKTHLARNRDIVDETEALVATPRLAVPEERGGTWYTIRYARKRQRPTFVVWPDGGVERPPVDA